MNAAIGTHVGYDVEGVLLQELCYQTIDTPLNPQQTFQQSFGKVFRHGFSWMLAMNQPTNLVADTKFDAVQISSLQCLAQGHDVRSTLGNEVQMSIVGVGWKVGKESALLRVRPR